MTQRYFIFAALFMSLASVVLITVLLMSNGPGVTKANFDRIEEGMTLQEVEQVFGRPGKYTWGGYYWRADDGAEAFVGFNFNGDSAGPKTWKASPKASPLDK